MADSLDIIVVTGKSGDNDDIQTVGHNNQRCYQLSAFFLVMLTANG